MIRRRRRRATFLYAAYVAAARSAAPARPGVAAPHRALQDCGATPAYAIEADQDIYDGLHEGSTANPIVMQSGCPVTLRIAPGQHAFLVIPGFNTMDDRGYHPTLEWAHATTDPVPFVGYSWDFWPVWKGNEKSTRTDWYWWPASNEGAVVFWEDHEKHDVYHCRGGDENNYYQMCQGEGQTGAGPPPSDYVLDDCGPYGTCFVDDLRFVEGGCGHLTPLNNRTEACPAETDLQKCDAAGCDALCEGDGECGTDDDLDNCGAREIYRKTCAAASGELRVGVSLWEANSTEVTFTATLLHPEGAVDPADLDAVAALWRETCRPYLAPSGWSWRDYQLGASDTIRGERDSRRKPYCDWFLDEGATDCREVDGVVCEGGRVVELALAERGLRGQVVGIAALDQLRVVNLGHNRLNDSLPAFSDQLERLLLSNNFFDGPVPCASEMLADLELDRNDMEGAIPGCLLDGPRLSTLDLGHNRLDGPLPHVTQTSSRLQTLRLPQAGLSGSLDALANLTNLVHLDLSRNFLTGTLSNALLGTWEHLVDVDLSWNYLEGAVPDLPTQILKVDLGHNALSGTLGTQFTHFRENQRHGLSGWLRLNENGFCGPLPAIFYDLLYDTHVVTNLDVSGNHFCCAVSNRHFEAWARATGHDFGECTPVAMVTAVSGSLVPGGALSVAGSFVASTSTKCAFTSGDVRSVVEAAYVSPSELRCTLPLDWPPGRTVVDAAHYCDDFSSVETLGDLYAPVAVDVVAPARSAGGESFDVDAAALGGGAAVAAALLLAGALAYVIKRELAGRPVFTPAAVWEANPIAGRADDVMDKGDVVLELGELQLERLKAASPTSGEEHKDAADVLSPRRASREGMS